jgi:hypothetical protein
MTIKFEVINRFSGAVQFTAEIECGEDESYSIKLGLAVKWGIKARADLTGANITDADLTGANLADANLAGADLTSANLTSAYLARADLTGAYLARADLTSANLTDANLAGAKGAEIAIAKTRILPEGDLIGWKKCKSDVIVKLKIPADAKRSHAFGRKCRAQFADVLEVIGSDHGIANHDGKTKYVAGERVTCHEWDENWQQECAGGIHFFITREEAETY